jgi:hypothetical protein
MTLIQFNRLVRNWGATDDTELCYMDMNFGDIDSIVERTDIDYSRKLEVILFNSRRFEELD